MATNETTTTAMQLKCPHCEATFQKKTGLGSHLRIVHGVKGTSKAALEYHAAQKKAGTSLEKYRTKAGKYKCPECGAVVANAAALGSHRQRSHNIAGSGTKALARAKAGDIKLDCPECGESFKSGLALGHHRKFVHGISGTSRKPAGLRPPKYDFERTSDGRYQCPHCEFAGTTKAGMGMHMKMHRTQEQQILDAEIATTTERKELAKNHQNAATQISTNNGHHPQAQDDGTHRLEAAATFAAGRVQELCSRIAFEHDLPARTLTALVLRTVANTSALR